MTKNKFAVVALSFAVLTLGAGCSATTTTKVTDTTATSTTTTDDNEDYAFSADIIPGAVVVKTGTTVVVKPTTDYVSALATYQATGARIQFANCSGNPGTISIKKNTKFMLDNRDNEQHIIGIGTKTYKLGAYDFAIVSVIKAGTHNITCDGGGAAQVTVQN